MSMSNADRNVVLAAEMAKILLTSEKNGAGPHLFAIGLAHWQIGDQSLEALLRDQYCYVLKRVRVSDDPPQPLADGACDDSSPGDAVPTSCSAPGDAVSTNSSTPGNAVPTSSATATLDRRATTVFALPLMISTAAWWFVAPLLT